MAQMKKSQRVTDLLPVKLTNKELLKFGDALAEASQSVEIAERNKKSALQSHTAEIRIAEARREKLASIVGSHSEYREVVVEETWDWEKDKYTRTRTDTGEIILDRHLTGEEKQMEMIPETAKNA